MAHTVKKDPFVPVLFLIGAGFLGGAVFVLVSNLYSTVVRNSVKGAEDNSRQVAVVAESLKPVGRVVTTADAPAAAAPVASGPVDGEAVYKGTCQACHATGVAGAPLFANKEKWEPRIAQGLDGLMNSALNGKGAMPPKGGNTALSDAEIKAAILHMTKAAGFDLGGGDATKKADAPVAVSAPVEKKAEPAKEAPVAPAPVADKKAEPATKDAPATAPTKPEPVAEPAKPETPATPAVPSAPIAPAPKEEKPVVKAEPAATPSKEEKPAAPATPAPAKEAKPAPAAGDADLKKGESVYNSVCFACHKTGVAGAPIFGNKELWAPRIATGMDALVTSVTNGKGAMPPKGGNPALTDDDLKAAVAYMVTNSK